jgi:mono/diheme cytochrome c family protein
MTLEKGWIDSRTIVRPSPARAPRTGPLLSLLGACLLAASSALPPVLAVEPKEAAGETVSTEATAEAKEIYRARCVLCHGESGKGDGAGAMAFDPRPRDFGDPAWQGTVTDEYIERIIARGGVAVGKSPSMPPNPDLQSRPEVVRALRQIVRGFARK